MERKYREGDMVEVGGGLFDVKGFVHPPSRVIASLHFLRKPEGDRIRGGIRYSRILSFPEQQRLTEKNFSHFLIFDRVFGERLCELPLGAIEHYYRPTDRLRELRRGGGSDEVEKQALSFLELLKRSSKVSWGKLGISGSILVKLYSSASDIDPIVYGSKNCRRVYTALKVLLESGEGGIKPNGIDELRKLFGLRYGGTTVSWGDFIRTERRKVLGGVFLDRGYSIKFVKDWDEIMEKYGSVRYSSMGHAKIRAKIVDDSEAIFTPCSYQIENAKILEGTRVGPIEQIVSFRMRFCEQARNGEEVVAEGKVERVQKEGRETYRLMIGNRTSDFIILATS